MSWQQSTVATGCEHGVDEVFDMHYAPTDADSHVLFAE